MLSVHLELERLKEGGKDDRSPEEVRSGLYMEGRTTKVKVSDPRKRALLNIAVADSPTLLVLALSTAPICLVASRPRHALSPEVKQFAGSPRKPSTIDKEATAAKKAAPSKQYDIPEDGASRKGRVAEAAVTMMTKRTRSTKRIRMFVRVESDALKHPSSLA